jgi:hypothetical protein
MDSWNSSPILSDESISWPSSIVKAVDEKKNRAAARVKRLIIITDIFFMGNILSYIFI